MKSCRICRESLEESQFKKRGISKITATCIKCSEERKNNDYCPHNRREHDCYECTDPIVRRATSMIHSSRMSDKRKNRKCDLDFTTVLHKIVDNPLCVYCDIELQYVAPYLPNHCTIDRINDLIGHTNENCVISCRRCNCANYKFLSPKYNEILLKH